jgi:hypothetical protein
MGERPVEELVADREVRQGAPEPLAVGLGLGQGIAQAAATFPLT